MKTTRAQKAAELMRLLGTGPQYNYSGHDFAAMTPTEIDELIQSRYRIWATSWVTPLVRDLVKECKQEGTSK